MSTRSQSHEIDLQAAPEAVFKTIMTPKAIRGAWGSLRAVVMDLDGRWVVAWGERENNPDYVSGATIKAFEAPRRLFLAFEYCRGKAGALTIGNAMTAEFTIQKMGGGCRLRVTHTGIPTDGIGNAYFESAKNGWMAALQGIKQLVNPPSKDSR